MNSVAQKVKESLKDANIYTLEYGYGFSKGRKIEFPLGVRLKEKRNEKGRCIYAKFKYADNSILIFKYNQNSEKATLTVEGS